MDQKWVLSGSKMNYRIERSFESKLTHNVKMTLGNIKWPQYYQSKFNLNFQIIKWPYHELDSKLGNGSKLIYGGCSISIVLFSIFEFLNLL